MREEGGGLGGKLTELRKQVKKKAILNMILIYYYQNTYRMI